MMLCDMLSGSDTSMHDMMNLIFTVLIPHRCWCNILICGFQVLLFERYPVHSDALKIRIGELLPQPRIHWTIAGRTAGNKVVSTTCNDQFFHPILVCSEGIYHGNPLEKNTHCENRRSVGDTISSLSPPLAPSLRYVEVWTTSMPACTYCSLDGMLIKRRLN